MVTVLYLLILFGHFSIIDQICLEMTEEIMSIQS